MDVPRTGARPRTRRAVIAAAALAALAAPTAAAQKGRRVSPKKSAAADEASILRIAQETFDAIRRKDIEAINRHLADDFVHRTPGEEGDAQRGEFLNGLAEMPFKILSVRGERLKVSVYGDVAVLTGVQHARVELETGREASNSVAFTDVFVRRGGRWLMTLAYGVELPAPPQTGGEP